MPVQCMGIRDLPFLNNLLRDENSNHARDHGGRGEPRPAAQLRPVLRARPPGHSRRTAPIPIRPADMGGWIRVPIRSSRDIPQARHRGRELATALEFPPADRTLIASAISELGRNIVRYAEEGEIRLRNEEGPGAAGVAIVATDSGPGIRDVRTALQHSASRGLGLGLPGVRRIMDEFEIISTPRQGTTVTVKKWKPQ